ncbi:endonuclease VIII [Marinobacter sp. C2H3]|uniref:endonuclease VIII n=1 Tax=Marinobacter sp. C2H3 TaxID=3119003 RepID=UPI00300EEE6B
MPEGPEIRRMVDGIRDAVGGEVAERVFFAFDHLKPFEGLLAGRRVASVDARGKAVLVHFDGTDDDGPWCVYSHNQLYGKWQTGRSATEPSTNRQLRFAIMGPSKAARLYSASDIRLVRPDALHDIDYIARLGPDPVNQPVTADNLLTVFQDKRFRGRALGGLLLDQGFVAGVGNYLRSEILFEARIAPGARPKDLDDDALRRLADATLTLIERTYRLKGITNDPERAERLKREGWSFARRRHMVFSRSGEPCHECGTGIVKTQVASRRLYYCPACQAAPG